MYLKLLKKIPTSCLLKPRYLTTKINDSSAPSYTHCDTHNLSLIGKTIVECLNERVLDTPNEIAYKFCLQQRNFSFLELKQRADEIAQNLLAMGFRKGDRLSIMLPNMAEFMLMSLACASIGVIVALMNPAYQTLEVEYMLKKTGSKGIMIMDNFKTLKHYELLSKICPEMATCKQGELHSHKLPHLKHIIMANLDKKSSLDAYKNVWQFDRDIAKFSAQKNQLPHIDIDDKFAMIFTVKINLIFKIIFI